MRLHLLAAYTCASHFSWNPAGHVSTMSVSVRATFQDLACSPWQLQAVSPSAGGLLTGPIDSFCTCVAGQLALAYVTAKTHGLEEEAARVAESIGQESLPEVNASAPLLLPPTPILKEDNWPLLTVTKGFFENLAQQGAQLRRHGPPRMRAAVFLQTAVILLCLCVQHLW